ncbi:VOC family protein [Spirillospora sp. NPDC048911]|uniref:VOC family protein n=1 Tax=Spirillospora sp. NPDC048911 TaxID=3364527 RepID=UPI00371339FA
MAGTMIFVNLAVRDLEQSKAFWSKLGYSFDPMFTDENAACLVLAEGHNYAMLLTAEFFAGFLVKGKAAADAATTTETMIALSADSREEVDRLVDTALASGGSAAGDTMDMGPMYGRSFQDPDGHHWEVMHMDMAAMEQAGQQAGQ